MIYGFIDDQNEAVVRLKLSGPDGVEMDQDLIVDTAFSGMLCLPNWIVAYLRLIRYDKGYSTLADGSTREVELFLVDVEWEGVLRSVRVVAIGTVPLLGMELLLDHKLEIDVVPGGAVRITQI